MRVMAEDSALSADPTRPLPGRSSIESIVHHVVGAGSLIVASDFDGVLAPLVGDPARATAHTRAVAALRQLAWMPRTRAAIVSGRGLDDLRHRLRVADGIHLIGSHGAEVAGEVAVPLTPVARNSLRILGELLRQIELRVPGARIELKPRGVAFHYREVDERDVPLCLPDVLRAGEQFPALRSRPGSMVVEFVADACTKGDALRRLRDRVGSPVIVFLGDDLTDEHAFAALSLQDAGVKVGPGDTLAGFRIPTCADAASLLEMLALKRAEWLVSRRPQQAPSPGALPVGAGRRTRLEF